MGGPVEQAQQTISSFEPENTSDSGSWAAIVHDIVEDILETNFTGGTVLLLLGVALGPMAWRSWLAYRRSRSGRSD